MYQGIRRISLRGRACRQGGHLCVLLCFGIFAQLRSMNQENRERRKKKVRESMVKKKMKIRGTQVTQGLSFNKPTLRKGVAG